MEHKASFVPSLSHASRTSALVPSLASGVEASFLEVGLTSSASSSSDAAEPGIECFWISDESVTMPPASTSVM